MSEIVHRQKDENDASIVFRPQSDGQSLPITEWQRPNGQVRAELDTSGNFTARRITVENEYGRVGITRILGRPTISVFNDADDTQAQLILINEQTHGVLGGTGAAILFGSGGEDFPDITINKSGDSTLSTNANITVDGDLEITDHEKGVILRSPDDSRWRITVDNDGNLSTTQL